jgi:hypothetical protein
VTANSPLAQAELYSIKQHLIIVLRVSSRGQNLSEVLYEEHDLPLVVRAMIADFAAAIAC